MPRGAPRGGEVTGPAGGLPKPRPRPGPSSLAAARRARRRGGSQRAGSCEERARLLRVCRCARVRVPVCRCACACVCARVQLYVWCARARACGRVCARAPGRGASGPGGRQEEELCRLRMNVLEGARRGGTERQRRGARSGGPSAGAGGGGGTGRTRSRARGRDAARGRGPGLGRRWWPRAAADLPAPLAGCRARPCSGRRGEPAGSFPPGVFGEEAGREEDGEGRRGELVRPPERGPL